MQFVEYPYTANFESYVYDNFANEEHNIHILGHIRFLQQENTIYELIYLMHTQNSKLPQYYKLEWYQLESDDAQQTSEIIMETIIGSDMDEDEAYYTIVFDIKEICTETPKIDELLFMYDSINIRGLMWDYLHGLYLTVYWCQDKLTPIPNYVSGFLRNICIDDVDQCAGNSKRIPLLSALIYSHGIYAVFNLLDIIPNRECLIDINDPTAPLFAFWHMLEGDIRKKIWTIFDIIDFYYDENYRILLYGPTTYGKSLLQVIYEEAYYTNPNQINQIYNYIAEIRNPDWFLHNNTCE